MLDDVERRVVQQVEAHAGTDVLVVLVPPLKVVHVGRQVGVDEAEAGVVEHEAHGHATLITLHTQERLVGNSLGTVAVSYNSSLLKTILQKIR